MLPLRPVSLTHKNFQRRKIICGMHPAGRSRKDRVIDLKIFFLEYPVCMISVAVTVAVVRRPLFLLVLLCFTMEEVYFYFSKL